MKKVYVLNGLDCTVCAAKIEDEVKKIGGIKSASLNFINKKLEVDIQTADISDKIIELINKIEPDVIISDFAETFQDNTRMQLVRIIIAAALFAIGFFISEKNIFYSLLYMVSYVIIGYDIIFSACKNIFKGKVFDENFLMTIATIGAFVIGELPEAVAVMLFYQIGEYFQQRAVFRSRRSIADLVDIQPVFANILQNGKIVRSSPKNVNIGDILVVGAGEKIPVDGIVISGNSFLDTAALTGESLPQEVFKDSPVISGCINSGGTLKIKAEKKYTDSTVSKILELLEDSGSKKASSEKFITKFAAYYTPVVVITAFLLALIPSIIYLNPMDWIYRACVFLVISCPCALVISIPLSFFAGIGKASKKGILVKGGNYLEALAKAEIAVFDKTGTLTKGVFKVLDICPHGITKQELLMLAAYGESSSTHPIAKSILDEYGKPIEDGKIENCTEIPGLGVKALFFDKTLLVGNTKLMQQEKISISTDEFFGTVIHIALSGEYKGYITIADEIKEDSEYAISGLKKLGLKKIVMLTGDSDKIGQKVGNMLGIDEIYCRLMPQDKVEKTDLLLNEKTKKGKLIFVGDGINDAPVLARADVGIAMGAMGSCAAIEAADVVIMTDNPSKIIDAINISRQTQKRATANIYFALGVKIVVLILGAMGMTGMWEAVFADVGVSLIAIINAIRK